MAYNLYEIPLFIAMGAIGKDTYLVLFFLFFMGTIVVKFYRRYESDSSLTVYLIMSTLQLSHFIFNILYFVPRRWSVGSTVQCSQLLAHHFQDQVRFLFSFSRSLSGLLLFCCLSQWSGKKLIK